MNYLELITKEEQETICDIIEGRFFKTAYTQNPKGFNQIKPGFRVKSLNDNDAVRLAKENLNHDFIKTIINNWIDITLKKIKGQKQAFCESGKSSIEATALALLDSVFESYIELYFKLIQNDNKIFISDVEKEAENIKLRNTYKNETESQIAQLNEQVASLKKELEELQLQKLMQEQQSEIDKSSYESMISELKEKNAELSKEVHLLKIKSELDSKTITDEEQIIIFEDKGPCVLVDNIDEQVSLFEVTQSVAGETYLKRLADLSYKGELSYFFKNKDLPPFFKNRDKIYYQNRPSNFGAIGFWKWSAVENHNNPEKDYITLNCYSGAEPIEILIAEEYNDINELIKMLKIGYEFVNIT